MAADATAGAAPPAREAVVEVDAEVNVWLARAATAIGGGSPDSALPALVRVLQCGPDAMASTNGVTFLPARKLALALLRAIPERTRAAYRPATLAPPDRPAGLASRPMDVAALETAYWSRLPGPAAAAEGLRLAGFLLDQGRYQAARRVLLDMLEASPAACAPRSGFLARLLVACARSGDAARAQWAWTEWRKEGGAPLHASVLETEIRALPPLPAAASNAWPMAYGGPARDGAPAAAGPELAEDGILALRWQLALGPGAIRYDMNAADPPGLPDFSLGRGSAVASLTDRGRRPAEDLVFAGGTAWLNGFADFSTVDLVSGRAVRRTPHGGDAQPDDGAWLGQPQPRSGLAGAPEAARSWLFDNRLGRAASFTGGRVFCVEENHRASLDENLRRRDEPFGNPQGLREFPCGNALAAYQADTARLIWRVGREVVPKQDAGAPEADIVWEIPYVDGILVDGDLSDWGKRGREVPLLPLGEIGGRLWRRSSVALGWSREGLLVRASVTDFDIAEHDTTAEIWRADSIELFLADRRGGSNCVQVVAGTGGDPRYPKTRLHIFDRRKSLPPRSEAKPQASVAGVPAPDGYYFEALLPWSNLGIEPCPGDQVGFQMYINNTGPNRSPITERFHSQGGTFADTRKMYTLRLSAPTGPAAESEFAAPREKERPRWQVNAMRFAAAPVPCAGLLLVPVEDDTGFGLAGLDPDSGMPVWRTRLTPGPAASVPRATPVNVAVAGTEAYVCGGHDAVSCVDGCDGTLRWTTFYELFDDSSVTNTGQDGRRDAWEESLVMVAGDVAVALPENTRQIFAFDRRGGTRLWTRPKPEGVDYVVGRVGAGLVVAGSRLVACVDLANGAERWRTPLTNITGRAAVCGREALVPCGGTLVRLRVDDGTIAGTLRVQMPDGIPLGNLYVHDGQLLSAGLERVVALVAAGPVLARLEAQLRSAPTPEAYVERGRLWAGVGRNAEAAADYRAAWKLQRGTVGEGGVRGPLMTALWRAAEQDAGAAQALYTEACGVATTATERAESSWRLAQQRERSGDTNEALALYGSMAGAPDTMVRPSRADENWKASAHRLAARRIRALLPEDDGRAQARFEESATQALARLGPTPVCTGLVAVATLFPRTAAGSDAGLKAARGAIDRGDLGLAEVILQRALALAPPVRRDELAGELVRLYARMKWQPGAARLREAWSRIGAGAKMPDEVERAPAVDRSVVSVPPPPWKLRWRKSLPQGAAIQRIPSGLFYAATSASAAVLDTLAGFLHAADRGNVAVFGCLSPETGLPRWQVKLSFREPPMPGEDSHIAPFLAGQGCCSIDLWSGAIVTNILLPELSAGGYTMPQMNRLGLVTLSSQQRSGVLLGVDGLTARAVWKRSELDSLSGVGTVPQPVASSADGLVLLSWYPDGKFASIAALDFRTGDIGDAAFFRRVVADVPWRSDMVDAAENPLARWTLELEKERLTMKDRWNGVDVWSTPPDMAIIGHQGAANGTVLALAKDEALLLSAKDGRVLCRSPGDSVAYDGVIPDMARDAVIAFHNLENGTNYVRVLDPAAGTNSFHGFLPQEMQPLLSFGSARPDQILVMRQSHEREKGGYVYRQWWDVVNERGENVKGLRLPRDEDLRGVSASRSYNLVLADGLILMADTTSGEVLAYEHDPD